MKLIVNNKQRSRSKSILLFVLSCVVGLPSLQANASIHESKLLSAILVDKITGTIVDNAGLPLAGVNVVIRGTTNGVITDVDGKFSIDAQPGDVLVISFIGMKSQEVTVEDGTPLEIVLEDDSTLLGDVVVVGYGTQKKSETTASISQVTGKDIANTTASSVAMSLQGRASGVEMVTSGLPGRTPSIRIRGTGTINNSQPLIVLDGVPVSADLLSQIAPSEIESIEILKDAASGAIYGTRAANGVMLVTTKKAGFGEKTTIRLNASAGINKMIRKYPVLNAEKLWELKRERYTMDGLEIAANTPWSDDYYSTTRTDWQDEMFQSALFTDYNIGIGSGSKNSTINTNLFYRDEGGTLINTYMKRYGISTRATQKLSSRLRLEEDLRISNKKNRIVEDDKGGSGTSETIYSTYRFNPAIPVKYDDGSYGSGAEYTELGDMWNPVYKAKEEWWYLTDMRTIITLKADFDITKDLTLTGRTSYQQATTSDHRFKDVTPDQSRSETYSTLDYKDYKYSTKLAELFATYDKFQGNHHLGITLGVSGQINESSYAEMIGQDFASTESNQLVMSNANIITGSGGQGVEYPTTGIASAFVRGTYAYLDKYFLSATFRADGSSRFAEGNRWGYFPAVSAGWRLSQEDFLINNALISNLKLNASWGQLGNQNVDPFQYLNVYQKDIAYTLDGENLTGVRLASFANTDITWETTNTTNILMELGMFNDMFQMNVAYFDRLTKNMLIPLPSMLSAGLVSIPDSNVGEMRNSGIELEPSYAGQVGAFSFNVGVNFTYLQNKVTKLYGEAKYLSTNDYNRTYEGQSLGTFYGYKTDGIYQTQTEIDNDPNLTNDSDRDDITPGDVRFVDVTGDGIVDDEDRVRIGNPNPKYLLGFNVGGSYKGFSISTVFSGKFGQDLYDEMMMIGIDPTESGNMDKVAYKRWTGEGTSNKYPRMSTITTNNNYRVSQLGIKDGSYLRMKNLTVGYTFTPAVTEKLGVSFLKLYMTGRNLITITKFDGVDPEESNQDNLQRGVVLNNTPQSKSLVFGVNITL